MNFLGNYTFNFAHLHLMINHLPVLLIPMSTLFLGFAFFKKNAQMVRFSLGVLFFSALTCVPVYFSGEPAEHQIEDFPAVRENVTHEHEESAEWAIIVSGIVAVVSGISFFTDSNRKYHSKMVAVVLITALFSTVVLARTAYLGGHVRHTETRGPLFQKILTLENVTPN